MASRIHLFVLVAVVVGCEKPPENPSSSPVESCLPKEGQKAPALSVSSATGAGKITIPSGKVTIVDFWATWCAPCKVSFPKYQELYVKYKASGLEMIAVSVDDKDDASKIPDFAKTNGKATFKVGWDDGHNVASCWKPEPMPTMFIVDKKGIVRHVHREWHDGDEKNIEKQIKALL